MTEVGVLLIGLSCACIVAVVVWDLRHGTCTDLLLRYAAAAYGILLLAILAGWLLP